MIHSWKLATRLSIFLAIAVPTVARAMNVFHPDGPYTQAPTGMTYPVAVGEFRRADIIRYKDDGTDESAGYNLETSTMEISATVYIFPSPSLTTIFSPQNVIDSARGHLCEAQFHTIQQEITSSHPDAVLVSQDKAMITQGDVVHNGYRASYTLTNANFFGRSQVTSRSDAYVFCYAGGKWTVEYRIDYPANYDAADPIAEFMRDLAWTIPPE
jgi:hypothetical protein